MPQSSSHHSPAPGHAPPNPPAAAPQVPWRHAQCSQLQRSHAVTTSSVIRAQCSSHKSRSVRAGTSSTLCRRRHHGVCPPLSQAQLNTQLQPFAAADGPQQPNQPPPQPPAVQPSSTAPQNMSRPPCATAGTSIPACGERGREPKARAGAAGCGVGDQAGAPQMGPSGGQQCGNTARAAAAGHKRARRCTGTSGRGGMQHGMACSMQRSGATGQVYIGRLAERRGGRTHPIGRPDTDSYASSYAWAGPGHCLPPVPMSSAHHEG